jgi:chaperonin cofactor prefoldin
MKSSLKMERIKETRPVIQRYFDTLINKLNSLEEETVELKKMVKSLTTQRDNAISQFDKLIIEKQTLETELYTKVLYHLKREKKAPIILRFCVFDSLSKC